MLPSSSFQRYWQTMGYVHDTECIHPGRTSYILSASSGWIEGESMDFTEEMTKAANTLMSEATLGELRELAQDLRALAPDSALADLVEVKIEQLSAAGDQD
jgi:hypothetical protein